MKKLYDPLPAGGAPIFTEALNDVIQGELWDVLEAMLSSVNILNAYPLAQQDDPAAGGLFPRSTGLIISGGDVTDNTTDWDMAAGIAILPASKKIVRFPALAGIGNTSHVVISEDTAVTTQKTFFDGSSKNYYEDVPGKSVENDSPTPSEFVSVQKNESAGGNSFMGHPTIGNYFKSLAYSCFDGGEIQMTGLSSSWTSAGYYRRIGDIVHIELRATGATAATADAIYTFPAPGTRENYRPARNIKAIAIGTTGTIYPVTIIASTGIMSIVGGSSSTETQIDAQIQYYV